MRSCLHPAAIEPAPGLVPALRNEICRPEPLNSPVSPGKPRVAQDATAESNQTSKISSTLLIVPRTAGDCHFIHERAVRVFDRFAACLFQFLDRADNPVTVALRAYPDGDRDPPIRWREMHQSRASLSSHRTVHCLPIRDTT